jgi:hypothetical protein
MTQQSAANDREKKVRGQHHSPQPSPATLHTSSWKLLQCWVMTAVAAMNCCKIVQEIMDGDMVLVQQGRLVRRRRRPARPSPK